jgi:uncharacterized protein YjbI with pentapeptide repeats
MTTCRMPAGRMAVLWAMWLAATVALAENPTPPAPAAPLKIGPGMNAVGRNLRDQRFWEVDLSGADFSDADLTNVTFECCNLQNVRFCGARMNGTYIEDCETTGADFTDAVIGYVERGMNRLEIAPEQLKATKTYASKKKSMYGCSIPGGDYDFRNFRLHDCYFQNERTFENSDFSGASLEGVCFEYGLRFDQLASTDNYRRKRFYRLNTTVFGPADFTGICFFDSVLRTVDEMVLENTRFEGSCGLGGKVRAEQIRATYNYRHGDLSRLTLGEEKVGDIDLSGLDLSSQNLTDVNFQGSFAGAKFDDAVISGAKLGEARNLTADQIRTTWNFKHGRMADIELPAAVARELGLEQKK